MKSCSYDEVQYESKPIVNSKPENLYAVASFFGMTPQLPEKARILELGCAGGGNIIPTAMMFPDSYCLGIDISSLQIDFALNAKKELNVPNIDFVCASITEIDESYGKFDYIICHGVFSWVPEEVRAAIFATCKKLLSKNGLAYISYNTMPGWSIPRTIRDIMLHYSNGAKKSEEILSKSRFITDFLKENTHAEKSYQELLKKELEKIEEASDHYIFHEHLEDTNEQFYFHEFMAQAKSHSLQYVAPAELFTMFRGNMYDYIAEKLHIEDTEEIEQYLDFIYNRRFRSSILCKDSVKIDRQPSKEIIKKFFLETKFEPEKPLAEIDIYNEKEDIKFYYEGDKETYFSRTTPISKAIFYSLSYYWNYPVSFDELVDQTMQILNKETIDEIEKEACDEFMHLIKLGYLSISLSAPKFINELSEKPKISDIAIYQAAIGQPWVTSMTHKVIWMSNIEKYIYRYLDGNHSITDIADKLLQHLKNGEIKSEYDDRKFAKKDMEEELNKALNNIKYKALLVG
ncbi:MAG: methyltransferase regulatory domain-containing protein [Rickettsiaceae bacterium]|nr:methyltransferase regulatory domain-containing protein [Rickettsiaceae bacterium]